MKRVIQGSMFFLVLSVAFVPNVQAETAMRVSPTGIVNSPFVNHKTTPFNLVGLAYKGFFINDNIPSYADLIYAYQSGKVSAKDIVQSAVNSNRIPQEVLSDREFLRAVDFHLQGLASGNG